MVIKVDAIGVLLILLSGTKAVPVFGLQNWLQAMAKLFCNTMLSRSLMTKADYTDENTEIEFAEMWLFPL